MLKLQYMFVEAKPLIIKAIIIIISLEFDIFNNINQVTWANNSTKTSKRLLKLSESAPTKGWHKTPNIPSIKI